MRVLYNWGIELYAMLISVASLFNRKARLFRSGRVGLFEQLATNIDSSQRIVWIHAASAGEFEQARPIIEIIKERYVQYSILVSFFSPSGYEMHKNYPLADYVYYLPLDTVKNARKWVELINPVVALFIKYEFWDNYLTVLKEKKIRSYSVSCIFRENQFFFKKMGGFSRRTLSKIDYFFTQDKQSIDLLKSIGIQNASIIGDTRFDRVYRISKEPRILPLIEKFCANSSVIIAGSSWKPDEDLLIQYISTSKDLNLKLILVPHEINSEHIESLSRSIPISYSMYSSLKSNEELASSRVLIVDQMGLLSSVYRYGDIAYIGGGFGVGIHNTLEAACYGIPVLFGPKYEKFNEAIQLIERKAGFSISNYKQLTNVLDDLLKNEGTYSEVARNAKEFVLQNVGSSEKLFENSELSAIFHEK